MIRPHIEGRTPPHHFVIASRMLATDSEVVDRAVAHPLLA
jgi:hypothetical protein